MRTMQDAIKLKTDSLALVKKKNGHDFTISLLVTYISHLNMYLNVTRPMNEVQIESCAYDIATRVYNITLADIHFVFTEARAGKYDLFEGLSGAKIINWFEEYLSARCDVFENKNFNEHHHYKHHSGESVERSSDKNKSQDIQTLKAIVNSKSLNRKK